VRTKIGLVCAEEKVRYMQVINHAYLSFKPIASHECLLIYHLLLYLNRSVPVHSRATFRLRAYCQPSFSV